MKKLLLALAWVGAACASTASFGDDMADAKSYIHAHDCDTCHSSSELSKESAPSFTAVSQRYSRVPDPQTVLVKSISRGCNGKWGGRYMPPYDAGLHDQATIIKVARFILAENGNE